MKYIFRLTKSNRLTLPYVLHELAKCGIPRDEVILLEDVNSIFSTLDSLTFNQRKQVILFYSFMTPHLKWVYEEVQRIKQLFPEVTLVAGGPHASGDPVSTLKMGFQVVFVGEVENSFKIWCERVQQDLLQNSHLIYYAQPVDSIDDSFPMNPYFHFYPPLEITRGCYWRCKFCQTATKNAIHRSFESIKFYIKELKRQGYLNRVSFICPSASEYGADSVKQLRMDKIEQVLAYVKSEGATYIEYGIFPSETRPNQITPEFLDLVKKYCNNKKITVGAQTGSDHALRRMRRGHLLKHIYSAAEMVHQKGFKPLLDFIIGFPDETIDERMEVFDVMKDLSRKYNARIQMHYFLPLSGTPLAQNVPTLLDEHSKQLLDYYHRSGISSSWWREGMKRSWDLIDTLKQLEKMPLPEFQTIYL